MIDRHRYNKNKHLKLAPKIFNVINAVIARGVRNFNLLFSKEN